MNAIFVIAGVGVAALIAEIVNLKRWLTAFVIAGLLGALYFLPLYTNLTGDATSYHSMVIFDMPAVAFTWLIVLVAALWFWMARAFFKSEHQTDKTSLVIFVVLGAVLMASFNNMAILFLGIEILSLSLYALAGSRRESLTSLEAAFKYFLMGSFATGFLLFGIALVYGATRTFDVGKTFQFLIANGDQMPGFFYAGVLLIMVGVAFKISAVPFHFWAPDVYDGSPTAVTALMATVVKIAAIAVFWRLFGVCFSVVAERWAIVVTGLVVLTLVIPNITAIFQTSVKRTLAYSSVGHVGYILLGFLSSLEVNNYATPTVTIFYLTVYSIASLAAFSVLMKVENSDGSFNGLFYRNPMLAVTMTVALLSMAGIPPLAGFAGKYYIFVSAASAGEYGLLILAILTSLVGVYYYFRIIIAMFHRRVDLVPVTVTWGGRIFHALMIVLLLALGLFPSIGALAQILEM